MTGFGKAERGLTFGVTLSQSFLKIPNTGLRGIFDRLCPDSIFQVSSTDFGLSSTGTDHASLSAPYYSSPKSFEDTFNTGFRGICLDSTFQVSSTDFGLSSTGTDPASVSVFV